MQGLYGLAQFRADQGDLPGAIQHIRRLLVLEAWREEAHRQLMLLLAQSGQRAAALAQFESCRRILEEELGVTPDGETVALAEAIRAGTIDKMAEWQGDKVNSVSERPVTWPPPHPVTLSLPIPPTPLMGREQELAELGELLGRAACRLVTLTGPGGIGKTRLALAVAADQSGNFRHGAVFVPLAGVSTAQFLPQAILTALNRPVQAELAAEDQLRLLLYQQECLLVLDNYEHLLPEIGLLMEILNYAPAVKLLVTSRERLALQAEHLRDLTGLSYPPEQPTGSDASTLPSTSYAAVNFFLQRARQTLPHFNPSEAEMAAIVRICRLTEGMPLALELAAAMLREQSSAEIAQKLTEGESPLASRLRDLPERHRSIQALFEHSWRLLNPSEQAVLRAISLFRGGFTQEAAQEVAQATPLLLTVLIDKSLLRRNPAGRYTMHELVRQYAHEQLVVSGALPTIHAAFVRYFLTLSEAAKSGLEGAEPSVWMARVEQEIDNLRAVLQWLILHRPEDGLLMTLNLYWLWQSTNLIQEGFERFASALARVQWGSIYLRANAYEHFSFLAICLNRLSEAEEMLAHSLSLYQELDGSEPDVAAGVASTLNRQSLVFLFQGNYKATLQLAHQSLEIARQSGSHQAASSAMNSIAEALYHQDHLIESKSYYEESLRVSQSIDDLRTSGRRLGRLGHLACALGDLTEADACLMHAMQLAIQCRDQAGKTWVLIGMARVAAAQGDYQRAAALLAAKEEIVVSPIARFWPMERIENEKVLATIHAHLDDATFARAWAAGVAMSAEQVIAYALNSPPLPNSASESSGL